MYVSVAEQTILAVTACTDCYTIILYTAFFLDQPRHISRKHVWYASKSYDICAFATTKVEEIAVGLERTTFTKVLGYVQNVEQSYCKTVISGKN